MDNDIAVRLAEQDKKLDAIFRSVEKTRVYFLILIWSSVALFVIPLILALFVVPIALNSYLGSFDLDTLESSGTQLNRDQAQLSQLLDELL